MNNDDFLDSLKADWKKREVDLDSVRLGMEQRENDMRRSITKARLSVVMFMLGGAAFAWFAWTTQDALVALGALAFLVATPFQFIELQMRQRVLDTDYMASGQSLLERGLRNARGMLRLLQFARWVSGFFLLFALMAFGLAFWGLRSEFEAVLIGGAWAVAGIGSYLLHRGRLSEARSEVENFQALLAEYQSGEKDWQ